MKRIRKWQLHFYLQWKLAPPGSLAKKVFSSNSLEATAIVIIISRHIKPKRDSEE